MSNSCLITFSVFIIYLMDLEPTMNNKKRKSIRRITILADIIPKSQTITYYKKRVCFQISSLMIFVFSLMIVVRGLG